MYLMLKPIQNYRELNYSDCRVCLADKKLYDAFISYSRMDDDFVVQQLFPKLTEMKFKVCVHKKDFIPGESKSNKAIYMPCERL